MRIFSLIALLSSAFIVLSSFTTIPPSINEATENSIVGRAMGSIRSNCDVQGELQYNIQYNSEYGRCEAPESFKRVTFYQVPNCPPNQPCIQVIRPIGYVILDCNDDVAEVVCTSVISL